MASNISMPLLAEIITPHPLAIAPFALLLLLIAVMPLAAKHWWEKCYPLVTVAIAGITAAYYVFGLENGARLLHSAEEYFSFIALLAALFVIAGGIHIRIEGTASPLQNVSLLAVGALLANLIGTTGASMILIRPFIRANQARWHAYHAVFFIFIVSNCGGALTPIGDPPLLLGYLRGVPFTWTITHLWPMWSVAVGALLVIFFLLEHHRYQPDNIPLTLGRIEGKHNFAFLAVALAAVFISKPIFLRELILIVAAIASYVSTRREVHRLNEFLFAPIREVAILFAGIFITMVPALDWLEVNARTLGIENASQFYWSAGALSAVLDNAPTYLTLLTTAVSLHGLSVQNPEDIRLLLTQFPQLVVAVSVACVFFGAMTYIGNGPNLMVKSIVEHAKKDCPHFFGYTLRFALPILAPVLFLIWLLFFAGR